MKGQVTSVNSKPIFSPDPMGFEDFLTSRQDDIRGAASELFRMLLRDREDEPDIIYDMALVGELIEDAATLLEKNQIPSCDPYWECGYDLLSEDLNEDGELACVRGSDCDKVNCPFLGQRR